MLDYKRIKKKKAYKELLKSGMFFEFYPELTGVWATDKEVINPSEMTNFIKDLKSKWTPVTETKTGVGYHGSNKGNEITYTMYFDEYRCEWTDKDRAFQGHVFSEIDSYLRKVKL
jgi:hypothetical protein